MNSIRQNPSRSAATTIFAALVLGLALSLPSLAGAESIFERASRMARETRERIARAQLEVEMKTRQAQNAVNRTEQTVMDPLQRAKAAADSIKHLTDSVQQTIDDVKQQGDELTQQMPGGEPEASQAGHEAVDGTVQQPTSEASQPRAAIEVNLAGLDHAWQERVEQEVHGELCARLARRNHEKQNVYAARVAAEMSVARGDVADIIAKDPQLTLMLDASSIKLESFATAAGSRNGRLSFTVTIENQTASRNFHLFDPAQGQSLTNFIAAGPAENDGRATIHGTVSCSAAAAKGLRSRSNLKVIVALQRYAFAPGNQPASVACATVADIGLVPVYVRIVDGTQLLNAVILETPPSH